MGTNAGIEITMKKRNYDAVVDDLGSLGDGIAGVVTDGASEIVPSPSFHCFVHRCSYPRHSNRNRQPLSLPLTCKLGSILDETEGFEANPDFSFLL